MIGTDLSFIYPQTGELPVFRHRRNNMLAAPLKLPPIHIRHMSLNFQPSGQPKIKFVNPNSGNFERNIRQTSALPYNMIKPDELKGKNVVICGSGPSLTNPDVLEKIKKLQEDGYILVALKKAIKVLHEKGFKIDYAVSMDPGAHIACEDRIYKAPGITHILASSSDPELFKYLEGEKIKIFHSACGLPNEVTLYQQLFTDGTVMGGGYNVTNRAAAAFLYMGVNHMVFAGADGGWRDNEKFYADGTDNRPGVDMQDGCKVDGVRWNTRPDMLASSVALTRLAKKLGKDRIEFLGDVMPAKLMQKPEEFLDACVSFQR